MSDDLLKGRGAQHDPHNRFLVHSFDMEDDYRNYCHQEGEHHDKHTTKYIKVYPKSIVNKITSPDIGPSFSLNPYQGCEHGCIYCYARNSHEYWGYSGGKEFEENILVKTNAAELLEKKLQSRNWQPETISLSGNTDCYQPIERKLEITRKCLKVFLKYKHPVGIITKNSLVLRDLDIIKELAAQRLIMVSISITSLEEKTRRTLEPRTATIQQRLKTVETLTQHNIPVNVMMAPIIPSINDHEILPLVKKVSELGASAVNYTIVRLNGVIGELFEQWIRKAHPERADRVLNQIADCHGGSLNDSRFGTRIKGEGHFATTIANTFEIARNKYLKGRSLPELDIEAYKSVQNPQLRLF